jgi:CBS domain-containing protein
MFDSTRLTAADIMTRDVVTVRPDTTLRQAAQMMVERRISALPVVDTEGRILGVVSETDLVRPDDATEQRRDWWLMNLAEGQDLSQDFLDAIRLSDRAVTKVMHTDVVSVGELAPLRDIARLIAERNVRRVVVLRDGKPVGIVARADLVRALSRGAG